MNTQRWLVEYDVTANPQHFVDTASAQGVHIIGVYPDALAVVAEASEKKFQNWVAGISVTSTRANAFSEEEINREENPHRRGLMEFWNQYVTSQPQKSHPHEGLSWDHPGFSPPDRPDKLPQ